VAALHGRHKQALQHYQTAAGLAEERALPHIAMGGVLLKMGQVKRALAAYEAAAERAPDDRQVLAGHAAALVAAGRSDEAAKVQARLDELERQTTEAAVEPPGAAGALPRTELLYLAGEKARQAGRLDAAVDAWLEASELHSRAGQLDAALDACQQALTVASSEPRVHLELARVYFLHGWQERAVERLLLLQRLLQLAPQPDVGAALARVAAEHMSADERLATLAAGSAEGTPAADR
jgi:tetratricopeptide (TPR) repeat protein